MPDTPADKSPVPVIAAWPALMGLDTAARYCGVSRRWIELALADDKGFPRATKLGARTLLKKSDLDDWIESLETVRRRGRSA
jgi:excisionase family DNA binding protein